MAVSLYSLPPDEQTMQQVWRYRLWQSDKARTVEGEEVEIIDPGVFNTGPGPDFSNARIRIGKDVWAGSVELHLRASDWHRHGHDNDKAYNNVILHVVAIDDATITVGQSERVLHQLVMKVETDFIRTSDYLLRAPRLVLPMCGDRIAGIASIFKTDWITALAFERIQRKADDIRRRLEASAGDWYRTVFITLSRGLGFGRNADNMERLARSIPFKLLLHHVDSVETVEALLFGQAGLLNFEHPADAYERRLADEYRFYAHKYGLKPIEGVVWQMTSRNGANTPHRRIAFMAKMTVTQAFALGISLCETVDIEMARNLFEVHVGNYWLRHSAFGHPLNAAVAVLGRQSIDLLIINVIVPLVYHRGEQTGREELIDAAIDMLECLKPEQNAITRGFADFDVKASDAFTSQALVQLHREYCEPRRCAECRLGHRILSENVSLAH